MKTLKEFKEYAQTENWLITTKDQAESDDVLAKLGCIGLRSSDFAYELEFNSFSTGVGYNSYVEHAWITNLSGYFWSLVFTYEEFVHMFKQDGVSTTQNVVQNIIHTIKNKDELCIPIDNQVQADVVLAILAHHGISATKDTTFKSDSKQVHHLLGMGCWVSGLPLSFNIDDYCTTITYEELLSTTMITAEAAESSENIKYKHIRQGCVEWHLDGTINRSPYNLGGYTIAYKQVGEDAYHVGLAICSDEDNYDKALGRSIAKARLRTLPYFVTEEQLNSIRNTSYHTFLNTRVGCALYEHTMSGGK